MKKIKVKQLRTDVAAAKLAWSTARKSKKPAEEIARLREVYELKLALLESAEADAKKDDDEIEVPEDKPADGKGKEGEGQGKGANDPGVIDLAELGTTITEIVESQINTALKGANLSTLTAETVQNIVADAIKAHKTDSTKPDAEFIKSVVATAVTEGMKQAKRPSRMQFGTKDAKGRSGQQGSGIDIEIPHTLCKENLPLHMKQLFNVVAEGLNSTVLRANRQKQIELCDISDEEMEDGAKHADQMWGGLRQHGIKALTSTGSGTGADFVPRDLASELYRRLYLESQLAQMMLARELDMPTDPWDVPMALTRPKFYRNNVQNREARASTPTTGKFTLATQKCMALVQYSYEVNEDSIIAVLPLLQRLLGEAAAESLESMIINGDSAATHMDADITDPDDVNKAWDGFRKLALAVAALKVDISTGGISRPNLLSLKRALGKWGRRPGDLVWITGGLVENSFLGLDEVITADKRGSAGTTQTGVINSYWGIPIVVSEVMREDLNAAGVYDGVTTTKGSVLLVRLSDFILGSRRDFMVEFDRNIKSQTNDIVASFRKAFKPAETPATTARFLSIGYNFNA